MKNQRDRRSPKGPKVSSSFLGPKLSFPLRLASSGPETQVYDVSTQRVVKELQFSSRLFVRLNDFQVGSLEENAQLVKVRDSSDLKLLWELDADTRVSTLTPLSPDELLIATKDSSLQVWKGRSKMNAYFLPPDFGFATALLLTTEGVLVGTSKGNLLLLEPRGGSILFTYEVNSGEILNLHAGRNGFFVSVSLGSYVHGWFLDFNQSVSEADTFPIRPVVSALLGTAHLVTEGINTRYKVLDATSGGVSKEFGTPVSAERDIYSLVSLGGPIFAEGSSNGKVRVVNYLTEKVLLEHEFHTGPVQALFLLSPERELRGKAGKVLSSLVSIDTDLVEEVLNFL